jgi:hypothetical protein
MSRVSVRRGREGKGEGGREGEGRGLGSFCHGLRGTIRSRFRCDRVIIRVGLARQGAPVVANQSRRPRCALRIAAPPPQPTAVSSALAWLARASPSAEQRAFCPFSGPGCPPATVYRAAGAWSRWARTDSKPQLDNLTCGPDRWGSGSPGDLAVVPPAVRGRARANGSGQRTDSEPARDSVPHPAGPCTRSLRAVRVRDTFRALCAQGDSRRRLSAAG